MKSKTYAVEITETLKATKVVKADNQMDAIAIVKKMYNDCDVVLYPEDHDETEFRIVPVPVEELDTVLNDIFNSSKKTIEGQKFGYQNTWFDAPIEILETWEEDDDFFVHYKIGNEDGWFLMDDDREPIMKALERTWDKPVPEDMWETVAKYCSNDIIATEAVFNARKEDLLKSGKE